MSRKEYDFTDGAQGAVAKRALGKTRITIRIDTDVLNWFRAQVHNEGGGNYQTLINEALRQHVRTQSGDLERIVRKAVREELKRAQA